ncbi:MAG: M15 family metallopeptidase [Gaiellaceae bacterium]
MVAVLLAAGVIGAPSPPFSARVDPVTRSELPYSYHRGCPVGPLSLRRIRLAYWGFDSRRHVGSLVVNRTAVANVTHAFGTLYADRFPIRRMVPIDAYQASDPRSAAADDTSAFDCRRAAGPGRKTWSAHAYGLAVDVNPVENPSVVGKQVLPAGGRRYLDRKNVRLGMAAAGGALVQAFALVGWSWGGNVAGAPDYQHFSANGK